MIKQFKDQCDICKKFKILKGFNNLCLCEECRNNIISNKPINKSKTIQLDLFKEDL